MIEAEESLANLDGKPSQSEIAKPVHVPSAGKIAQHFHWRVRLWRAWPGFLRRQLPIYGVTLVTLASGILNILSVMNVTLPEGHPFLRDLFPFPFVRLSRFSSLLTGFALIVSSFNIVRRKRRAWQVVLALSLFSLATHMVRGLYVPGGIASLGLTAVLLLTRRRFTVRSSRPNLRIGLLRLATSFGIALFYGVLGFWMLDQRHYGINFHIGDAVRSTLDYLSLLRDPGLHPLTRYGRWFDDSLLLIAAVSYTYAGFSLYEPVVYRFYKLPIERAAAANILRQYGRDALDYFKLWKDKSYFFDSKHEAFIAYRVAQRFAITLGDPSGPEERIPGVIREFTEFCRQNDWKVAFHQVMPDFLPFYKAAGYRKLKIGDCAVVDLTRFTLDGKSYKSIRSRNTQLEKSGIHIVELLPPIPQNVLDAAMAVSDEWLEIPGRRERSFTLGAFEESYVRGIPMLCVYDGAGALLAFLNMPPSYREGEATIDLMRRRGDAPNGIMDYLFANAFLRAKERGYTRFNLGLAPMSGFHEREEASVEERAIHNFFQHLGFLFSFEGLRHYKGKFASLWEPRYEIYKNPMELPRLAIAIGKVSTYREPIFGDDEEE
ncbi:MAG TPA: phosphatidylglycerol lysyltransferase domain-containing protein [Terriglobales bacterium]|nr:phosphatidylglycerol lysyltransferase domain-containing protein [Terriglobales bacterium]